MLDADDEAEPETGPLRRCVVTRERLPKERMIRFSIGPEREIIPDLAARLPGRGIWLSASADVVVSGGVGDEAFRRLTRGFAKAARGSVTVPTNLRDMLEAALRRRISDTLGLARRAGQAVAGFEKARELVRSGRSRLLVHASDGSLAERARVLSGCGDAVVVIDPLPGQALGRIFARDHVVHVAVSPGRLADTLAIDAGRLAGLVGRPIGLDGRNAARMNEEVGATGKA